MKAIKKLFSVFIVWRIFLLVPLLFGYFLIPYRNSYEFTNIFNSINLDFPRVVYTLANFDGVRYLSIAGRGYISEAAFFPLYPLLIKTLSFWSSHTITLFWIGLLMSNLCFLAGIIFFCKLLRLDYSNKISNKAVLMILIFPTAFFFGAVYSESLFFLLLVSSFYLARKKKWFPACLIACLLSVTRLVGIFILPALIWEYLSQQKAKRFKLKDILNFILVPLGFLGYIYFNSRKWGNGFYFIHAHGQLANSRSVDKIILFPQTVYRYFKILSTLPYQHYEWGIALLELAAFVLAGYLLVLAVIRKVRASYLVFSFLAFLLPSSSGTFSGLPRYLLVVFPIFIILAQIKNRSLYLVALGAGLLLQFLLLMFFSRGYYVS